jgi:hypothetical protein
MGMQDETWPVGEHRRSPGRWLVSATVIVLAPFALASFHRQRSPPPSWWWQG